MNDDSESLSTNRLEITDPETGKVGIRMTVVSGVPTIELRDKEGFQRLTVTIDGYPKVILHNQDGNSPLAMGGMDTLGYGVMVANASSGAAAILTADEDGELVVTPVNSKD